MPRASIAMAILIVLLGAGRAVAQPTCQPELTIGDASLSKVANLRRFWTASVHVDASRCASWSGLFALGFVRGSESAPDLEFAEPFLWQPGRSNVRVEFWADEAVQTYRVSAVAACPCRGS